MAGAFRAGGVGTTTAATASAFVSTTAHGGDNVCAFRLSRCRRECILHREDHESVIHDFAFDDCVGGDWFDDDSLQFRKALAVINHGNLDQS